MAMENHHVYPFLIGDTSSKGPFSIAMLVYRSVIVKGGSEGLSSREQSPSPLP